MEKLKRIDKGCTCIEEDGWNSLADGDHFIGCPAIENEV